MLDRTKDVIVIEVDQGLKFPGNDHLKQTILDEALEGRFILTCHNINITYTSTTWERINELSMYLVKLSVIIIIIIKSLFSHIMIYNGTW